MEEDNNKIWQADHLDSKYGRCIGPHAMRVYEKSEDKKTSTNISTLS